MADMDPKKVKAWATEYKNAKSEIQEIRDLTFELANANEGLSKSQIKQNQNMAIFLDATRKAADQGKANLKTLKDRAQLIKDISKGEMSLSQVKDKQQDIEKEILKIQRRYKGVNKAKGQQLISELKANKDMLNAEESRLKVQELGNKAIESADELTGGMASKAKDMVKTFKQLGPGIGMAVIGLTAAVALLTSFNNQQEAIADQFGAIGVVRMRDELDAVNTEATRLGIPLGEAQKTVSDLSNQFGISASEATELSHAVMETSKGLGISLDESTKLIGTLTTIGGLTGQQATDLAKQAQSLAHANDVAPDEVLKDVANNTELFAKYAKDGGGNVLRAAIQAKKLGLELSDVAASMEGMLDFQSSLNAEVEASVMLGRNVNLQKARELSLAGDIEGFQKEILKQIGGQAKFDKMNVLQKQALAKATGLTVDKLGKMVSKEKEAATLAGELNKQQISDLVSDETITNTAKLMNELKALGVQLSASLGPALNSIMGMFVSIAKFIEPIISNVYVLGSAIALLTAKMLINTSATLANSLATLGLVGAKKAEAIQTVILTTNKAGETTATVAQTTAEVANTAAKTSKLAVMGSMIVSGAVLLAQIIGQTTAYIANTAATIANTAVKAAGTIASYAAAAGSLILAAANYFAGAAAGSAASLGFGAPVLTALAIAGVVAMFAAFAKAKSAGDMMSPAGGKTMVSTKEGGLFEMSQNDDILAAPGLAAAVGGGGGSTVVNNTDTSAMEKQGVETNNKLDQLITVMLDSPKQIGRRVGTSFNDARNS